MRKFIAIFLSVLMIVTFIPIGEFMTLAAPGDDIAITRMEPDKVSASKGRVVTITGNGFGNDKNLITVKVFTGVSVTIPRSQILSVNNTQIIVMIPNNNDNPSPAQLIVEKTGEGSASIPFTYVRDPEITKIMTNTEVTIHRDNNGEPIKEPDGTVRRDKETFLEIYGNNINISGQNEIEDQVIFKGVHELEGTVVDQKPGYIKVKFPEQFEYNQQYQIIIKNKYGGEATYPKDPDATAPTISLAKHDITQLSTLKVNIGDKLGLQGVNFPQWSNVPEENKLKVYLVNPSGENEATIYQGTTPSSNIIEITVPQVATAGNQKVKVVDAENNTAVTFIDKLQVLPTPGYFELTAVSPNAGTRNGGTEVKLIGKGLNPGMKIKFGDRYATGVELDTEMTKGDTTVLKAITPPSNTIGPVNITIENPMDNGMKVFQGLYRYTEVENSLVFIDINPTEGFETGGTPVTLTGINFQRTTKDDLNKTITDEEEFQVLDDGSEANSILSLVKNDIKEYQIPGTDEKTEVKRIREVRIYFGGRQAEITPIELDDAADGTKPVEKDNTTGKIRVPTIINPDTGQQEMTVKTPQIALDPRTNTEVEVVVEIVTKYVGTADDDYKDKVVDGYTEKDTSTRKFTYKPVPSAPELLAVYNEEFPAVPIVDDDTPMAKGPSGSTVYIYGLDFRPDAKVYFFKETNKPINEYLVARNQGQVVSVTSLGYALKDKLVYRIEVVAPDIKELGEVTVLVQNGDKGRTKTLNEFINIGNVTDNEIKIRQFNYLSTPVINEITPDFGSTATNEKNPHHPVAMIKGDMFLVDNMEGEGGQTELVYPSIYAVPRSTITQELISNINNGEDEGGYKKYKAEVLEVTQEKDGKLIVLDGVRDRIGTKISVKLPSVEPTEKGYRDIIIINPDGGIARVADAFEYKEPKTKPEIIEVSPDKGNVEGGQKVVITGKGFDYDIREILVTVTIGGEIAKIDTVERAASGGDIVHITITTPRGTEGEKILQVLNNNDGGTGESTYTYTRVSTNPKITSITPGHGGPYTHVIIKGDDFVLPNPSATDKYEKMGTRVKFNEDELNLITTSKELEDGTTVTSSVYVADKSTIILTLPDDNELPDEKKLGLGLKDVTIINPDTTSVIMRDAFIYLSPDSKPKIDSITPNEGTRDGGTKVVIIGEDFRKNEIEVYFGEKKGVVEKVQEIEGNKYKLFVTTPSYPVDEKITDRVKVPVTVINSDGGSDTLQNGFTFRVPGSTPKITSLDPEKGSTVGYEPVTINGDDFRFDDVNENGRLDPGEALPKVYFGWEEAVDVQYSSYGVLIVKTPPQEEGGKVDITVTNPDAGTITIENGFTYEQSNPIIETITPDTVPADGGKLVTIRGSGFMEPILDEEEDNGADGPSDPNTPIYGEEIDVEVIIGNERGSSQLSGQRATVKVGDLEVEYDNTDLEAKENIFVKYLGEDKTSFKMKLGESRIILLSTGKDTTGLEGIKISLKEGLLTVTRRVAPKVKHIDSGTLSIITPPMDEIGAQDIKVVNRDGGTGKGVIIITDPDSKPKITDIDPKDEYRNEDTNEIDYYYVESTIDGELTFTIYGEDFRTGVKVFIGDQEAEVLSKGNNDEYLIVRSPKGKQRDIDEPLEIIVKNKDGESADSTISEIGEAKVRAYYIYREKRSNPVITNVEPNRGSMAGGDIITITGDDFRIGNIEVQIGANSATVLVDQSKYDKLVVKTPRSEVLGPVDIYIKNKSELGNVTLIDGFTYYSDPEITRITPNEVHNTGGQKVTIKGRMFLTGVKVFIEDTQVTDVNLIDEQTIEIIAPPGELGPKDVRIENTDDGSYTLKNGITYVVPLPDSPTGFVAYAGHERSITLRWDKTEGAHRYKIFGTRRTRDGYDFIAETEGFEYILKDLEPNTKYYFRLWAINEYGESIDYDYASTTTLRSRYDDGDDKYDETESKETVVNYTNGTISVDLPSDYSGSQYNLDFTDTKYDKYDKIKITVPMSVISYSSRSVWLNTKDMALYIPMYNLMYSTYYTSARNEKDANVIITVSRLDNAEKAKLTKGLTRKEKAKSAAYGVDIVLQRQRSSQSINITDGINFTIKLGEEELNKDNIYLATLNPKDNKLNKVNSDITQSFDINSLAYVYYISTQIEEDGKFIVIYKE